MTEHEEQSSPWPALRLVLDTNVVVAGLLWPGPPSRLLGLASVPNKSAQARLFSSPVLLDELTHTLGYAKFAPRIKLERTSVQALLAHYRGLVSLVSPTVVPRVVTNDPADDHVVAAAVAAHAHLIVSGDRKHLLSLGTHEASHGSIGIVNTVQALATLGLSIEPKKHRPS